MDLKCKLIMEEYREKKNDFVLLGETVVGILREICKRNKDMYILAIEHRVKAENSLAGKLELKGEKYSSLEDITDILGCRIICFFSDDVDVIAESIEDIFVIDRENSVDKREVIDAESFGYLSLHYICSLPFGKEWPDNICGKKFEIQIRTALQHTWAVINHDIGYKSAFSLPRDIRRSFSHVAGLLEVADEKFVTIRNDIYNYVDTVNEKISSDDAGNMPINNITLTSYMNRSSAMRSFLESLKQDTGVLDVQFISPADYVQQLEFLGVKTLGDLNDMLKKDGPLAKKLTKITLGVTDLDIISSNVALRYLCRARLCNENAPIEKIISFMKLSYGSDERALRQAKRLLTVLKRAGMMHD